MHDLAKNVLGGVLQPCSTDPMTGFFRTGDCQVTEEDIGNHGVCIVATEEFLAFSRARGNAGSRAPGRSQTLRGQARPGEMSAARGAAPRAAQPICGAAQRRTTVTPCLGLGAGGRAVQ